MEAWFVRHPGAVSSREQEQEVRLTAVHWRCQTMLWNFMAPIGSFVEKVFGGCWTTALQREFFVRNTSEYKLVGINP